MSRCQHKKTVNCWMKQVKLCGYVTTRSTRSGYTGLDYWIKRYVRYHGIITCRDDLKDGEANIEAFLMHLAMDANVAPSTQNQAMNALVFLYKHVLKQPMDKEINTVRASRKIKVPVVMTREEVARIIAFIEGIPQLIVKMLFSAKAIQFVLRKAVQKAGIPKHVTLSGFAGGEYLPLPASKGPAFPFPSAGLFGLPSAMSPGRMERSTELTPRAQGRRLRTSYAYPRWVPHLSSNLRSWTTVSSRKS